MRRPQYIRQLPDFSKVEKVEQGKLAYASPVRVLSEEGLRVLNEIVARENDNKGPSRGSRIGVRGLYYSSPWIRDFVSSKELKSMVEEIAGEELILAPIHNSTPQANTTVPGKEGTVEFWHWDSVPYVANIQLSPVEGMEGGDLELVLMNKHEGMEALVSKTLDPSMVEKMSYEAPGNMVVLQGSEILHHVTPITNDSVRSILITCFTPANVFKPDKTVLATEEQEDKMTGCAKYEFFRSKAWTCSNVLKAMVEQVEYTQDGGEMSRRLRSVSHELDRVADLLEERTSDAIGFYNEESGKHEAVYQTDPRKAN